MNQRQKIVQEQFLNNEEAVIRKLKNQYSHALKEITKKAQALQDDINRLGTLTNLATDEEEKARFMSMQQSKIYQKQYQDAMKKQIGSILDNMQVEEFKTVSEYLTTCYEDGFVGTMFDLQGQGIPLCFPMDQEAMVRAIQLDSKISNGLYTRLGEDVAVLKKKITSQISRGIATGMSFQEVAGQLSKVSNIGYNNAVRIARTEGHRIQVQSGMDACYKAKDKGADVVKQWDATLDSNTRESHVMVDGEVRELDEKFSNGLMFPGDPSGGAAEVVNCRCALLQRARWAVGGSFTKMNNETGEIMDFSDIDEYNEFKKQYLKAAENESQYGVKYGDDAAEVDFDYINSKAYKEKFSNLTNNQTVNDTLYDTANKILNHCSGTSHEDMYLINADDGTVFAKVTDTTRESGIVYTEEFAKKLAESKEKGIPIIGIHNHPQGTPPSPDDFRKAYDNGYSFGVIIGNNGQVYRYDTPQEAIGKELAQALDRDIGIFLAGGNDIDRTFEMVYNPIGLKYTIVEGGGE